MTGFTPFMARLLQAHLLEREAQAIPLTDEQRAKTTLGYLHRGEPLRSVPLTKKESNGR